MWLLLVLFPYFRYAMYLFSGDYYKSGLSFFVPFSMLIVASRALSLIDINEKINLRFLITTLIVLLILLYFPYLPEGSYFVDEQLRKVVVFFLFVYSGLIYLMSVKSAKKAAQVLILFFAVIEVGYFSSITVNK